jgi:perosamine synthetase
MIPVNVPLIAEEDIKTVEQAMREGWISSAGRYVEEFEQSWAAYCGCTDGIAVSNGTTALQVAVEAVGIGAGDEVIMPTYTIISCASAIVRAGAIPVLVDSEPAHWGMDVSAIAEKITPRTKAIMVVHMFGHPVDMDPIVALAEKHGLVIIEDAAQTHGAKYQSGWRSGSGSWKTCGGLGHISTFSFFANKLITTGEGGMVVTSNPEYAERSRSLRNLCFRPDRRFKHTEHGYQFRLTSLQSALALGQVRRIESIVELKRKNADLYTERLKDLQVLQLPTEEKWARSVFWVYAIVLADDLAWDATSFAAKLRQLGVETRPFFLGMHEQPVFHDMGLFKDDKHPVSERIAKRGLYLPSGLAITEAQIDEVSEKVRIALRSKPGE